jgi:hypothetical protein
MSKLGFLVGTAATCIAIASFLGSRASSAKLQDRIEELEEEAADLRQTIVRSLAAIRAVRSAPIKLDDSTGERAGGAHVESFQSALNAISERIVLIETQLLTMGERLPAPERRADESELRAAVLLASNRGASPEARVEALRTLRTADQRSLDVVDSMVDVISDRNVAASTRAAAIRHLKGVDSPKLKAQLLALLQNESDPRVKSEAVETLQTFYDDPAVLDSVRKMLDDPSERVRQEAAKRIDAWKKRQNR